MFLTVLRHRWYLAHVKNKPVFLLFWNDDRNTSRCAKQALQYNSIQTPKVRTGILTLNSTHNFAINIISSTIALRILTAQKFLLEKRAQRVISAQRVIKERTPKGNGVFFLCGLTFDSNESPFKKQYIDNENDDTHFFNAFI